MPPYEITLINVDKDSRFTASQYAVVALIESFKVSADGFEPQLRSHRTSSRSQITELILQPTHLLHIMSHGALRALCPVQPQVRFGDKYVAMWIDGLPVSAEEAAARLSCAACDW